MFLTESLKIIESELEFFCQVIRNGGSRVGVFVDRYKTGEVGIPCQYDVGTELLFCQVFDAAGVIFRREEAGLDTVDDLLSGNLLLDACLLHRGSSF